MISGSNNMIKYIKNQLIEDPKKAFDARNITARLTCDVISSCIFGLDAKSFESENPEIFTLGRKMFRGISDSVQSMFSRKLIPREPESEFIKLMTDAMNYRIESKLEKDDFLSHIIQTKAKRGQTDVEAAAHAWTFVLDSFDTSAAVAHQAFYEIARDKRVQDTLRDEIMENIDEDGNLTFETLSELPYLDQVFFEILRLHPPFMFTNKVCSEEIELDSVKGHKFTMKEGATVMVSIYSIHRDPG